MSMLVLINGAPGSGKSTLARRYVDEHPLALSLDVDVVRGMLGAWLRTPIDAGLAARALSLSMARTHLGAGLDVVVPQFLPLPGFIEELDALAHECRVDFVEVVLLAEADDLRERFERRSADPRHEVHRDAEILLARTGGPSTLGALQDQLLGTIETRPRTHRITGRHDDVDGAYRELERAVSSALR